MYTKKYLIKHTMKFFCSFCMIMNVSTSFVIAQTPITLTNNNMPGSGDTLRYTNAQLASVGNYTQTGANFSWNFSSLVSTTEGVRSFKSTFQIPEYVVFFFGPNEYGEKIADTIGAGPLTITNYYNYYKKQTSPSAFVADGVGMTYNNFPYPSYYSDKDELYHFPMTYLKYDSSTFKFSTGLASFLPISYSKTGYRVTKVDGWGSVTTPYGTENCLRLVTTQYAMDSVITQILSLGFQNYQRSYQWLTTGSKIPYLEITGNLLADNFTMTQVRYRGYPKNNPPMGMENQEAKGPIHIYPNPAKERLFLGNLPAPALCFEIHSPEGKLIRKGDTGNNASIDVSDLETGIYFLKISEGQSQNFIRFMKE